MTKNQTEKVKNNKEEIFRKIKMKVDNNIKKLIKKANKMNKNLKTIIIEITRREREIILIIINGVKRIITINS